MKPIEMLLINVSNFPGCKIYPYAFVQVAEVARRFSVKVKSIDLSFCPPKKWKSLLDCFINNYRPKIIGLTLRNTDTLSSKHYLSSGDTEEDETLSRTYFPVYSAKELVLLVRELTDVPIVVGGCGYTIFSKRLLDYLDVDFGIEGEPEPFFENFSNVISRSNIKGISNLVYREGGLIHNNKRELFPPSLNREYDDEIIDNLIKFYGVEEAYCKTIPIEIGRGCPHECSFCCEPKVYGKMLRMRDIEIIMDEVKFVHRYGFHSFWLVCSEINAVGNEFFLKIAEEMIKFSENRRETPTNWRSYYLPTNLSTNERKILFRSGFRLTWNEIVSLDDDNLRQIGVPYGSEQAQNKIRDYNYWLKIAAASSTSPDRNRLRPLLRGNITLFLGNKYSSAASIRKTLQKWDDANLAGYYDNAEIFTATRIFGFLEDEVRGDHEAVFSVDEKGECDLDFLHPSFAYAKDILDKLGSRQALEEFFQFLQETFFSNSYRQKKDWVAFLTHSIPLSSFVLLLKKLTFVNIDEIREVLVNRIKSKKINVEMVNDVALLAFEIHRLCQQKNYHQTIPFLLCRGRNSNLLTNLLIMLIIIKNWEKCLKIIEHLGYKDDFCFLFHGSIYRLMAPLYLRYNSNSELLDDVSDTFSLGNGSIEFLFIQYFLHFNNIIIRPDYREFLYTS